MKHMPPAPSPPGTAPQWIDPPTVLGDMIDFQIASPPSPDDEPARGSLHVLPEGTRLLDYEIVGLIGEGGFGIVYLAYDAALERHVAIKEYLPAVMASRASTRAVMVKSQRHADAFSTGLRSFVNEARLLARFDHPSLVKVLRFWEGNGTAYMVMPFYEGPTLTHALQNLGRAPTEQELLGWLRPLLHALSTLHAARCYHRDIAPDNILLTPAGPLLLDFGAARRVVGQAAAAPTVVIKPGYAPIEQYGEAPTLKQGPWTDVYALGGVVYAAIAGQPPLPAVERWIDDRLPPLSEIARGRYSSHFLAAVGAALALRPADRPESAAAFWAQLNGPAGAEMPLAAAAPAAFTVPLDVDAAETPEELVADSSSAVAVAATPVAAVPLPEAEVWDETEFAPYDDVEVTPARDVAPEVASLPEATPLRKEPSLDPPPSAEPALALRADPVADLPAAIENAAAPVLPPPPIPEWAAPPSLGTVARPWEARKRRRRYVVLLALLLAVLVLCGWAFNAMRSRSGPPATPAVVPSPREAPPTPAPAAVPLPASRATPEAPKADARPGAAVPQPAAPASVVPLSPPATTKPAALPAPPAPPAEARVTPAEPKAPRAPARPIATAPVPAPPPAPAARELPPPAPTGTAETRRRCTDVLQRASIEPLRPAELAFLKRECR
ncbi:serine/threonine protein kinase [Variovorax sp. ZT4R33]|uniref:serine/threonine protein kinase n=1 Tax=Variovorax sp. ZT4R33 TaxID=3443743 RepID=UPI003F451BD2